MRGRLRVDVAEGEGRPVSATTSAGTSPASILQNRQVGVGERDRRHQACPRIYRPAVNVSRDLRVYVAWEVRPWLAATPGAPVRHRCPRPTRWPTPTPHTGLTLVPRRDPCCCETSPGRGHRPRRLRLRLPAAAGPLRSRARPGRTCAAASSTAADRPAGTGRWRTATSTVVARTTEQPGERGGHGSRARRGGRPDGTGCAPCRTASGRSSSCATTLDLSERQIADTLGISPGAVKTHAHRALAALRGQLDDVEDDDDRVRRQPARLGGGLGSGPEFGGGTAISAAMTRWRSSCARRCTPRATPSSPRTGSRRSLLRPATRPRGVAAGGSGRSRRPQQWL